MFNPIAYENSRPDGIGVLEILNGREAREGYPHPFVPLKRTELRGEIVGPLASLHLIQVYGYSKEQSDKVLEALYRFPLPGDAAVTGVRVHFGEVEIRAELKERKQAEAVYEEAKRQGRAAALATRESPDVFTLQVAGIQPDQDVTVETSYVQLARAEGEGWSLRVPLTTAPRYVRSDELTSRPAHGQPLWLLRDPGHRFALDVTLRGAGSVESTTHALDVTEDGDGTHVRLRNGEVLPDRDCVLSWRPRQRADRPALQVWLHDDPGSGQVYFLALVAPPAVHEPGHGVPREVILLVDHSGSMEGPKWEAANWAVERFLSDLTDRDTFALGLFHTTTRWFSRVPLPADADTVEAAIRFLREHKDSGGTELGVALEQALDLTRSEGERMANGPRGQQDRSRHVLVVTDAQVTDAGRILRLAGEEAMRKDRRRISVLCIDAAPNSFLAAELAERGGGVARFLTSAPEEEDMTTVLNEVLADWAEPVLSDLRLSVSCSEIQASGREVLESDQVGWGVVDLGDLPSGRTIWVVGRIPRGERTDLPFRVMAAGDQDITACHLDLTGEGNERPALKALFGARRVLGLEHLIHSGYRGQALRDPLMRLGYDPQEVLADSLGKRPKVYAENVRADVEKALRGLLMREALDYGLASSETGFIAVRTEAGKRVEGTVAVANALPAGWSDDFVHPGVVAFSMPVPRRRPKGAHALGLKRMDSVRFLRQSPTLAAMAAEEFVELQEVAEPTPLFSGVPQFMGGEAVLFDSSRKRDADTLPTSARIHRLVVRFPDGTPDHQGFDRGLSLLLFVGDVSSPRARVRLVDLIRRGERPLNLLRRPGEVVRIVLVDRGGAWTHGAPKIEVALGCQRLGG